MTKSIQKTGRVGKRKRDASIGEKKMHQVSTASHKSEMYQVPNIVVFAERERGERCKRSKGVHGIGS